LQQPAGGRGSGHEINESTALAYAVNIRDLWRRAADCVDELFGYGTIKQQDAVIAYNRQELLRDASGRPLSRWDGVTKKFHPITGEEIPDPDAQVPLFTYVSPKRAPWPEAEFVVGKAASLLCCHSPDYHRTNKRAPDLESRDPALAIECIHKQLNHIPSTLATKSQKSRRNVLDVDANAVPAQRVRRVDRGDPTVFP
jgi:hypothetical protein